MVNSRVTGVRDVANDKAKYHHGALRSALLESAEALLRRDGLDALTLRATAREAGVSHAAPKNHFDNLQGLLSELAARGFERFRMALMAPESAEQSDRPALGIVGLRYVAFARDNPDLFVLMFRNTRLDYARPALKQASAEAFTAFANAFPQPVSGEGAQDSGGSELDRAARIARAWSLVHGYAMLLIDGRLNSIMERLPNDADEMVLLERMLGVTPN